MDRHNLLDCTLRDGGYINDWNFGHNTILSIYKRLEESGVEFIEVGFLDENREFDINRSIVPNTKSFDIIFSGIKKKKSIPVAMIDFGKCSIENIGECKDSFIDGIRVIFKKEKIDEALPFCNKIKNKGYKLFIQAISITSYSDIEMLKYIEKINIIKPYAFSIVDTYGLLDRRKLKHYFNLLDNNLDKEINIGYHSHNNFQLGFSNTMKFISLDTKRKLIADSTVYGMGKSAGNCPSELISLHMNEYYGKNYDINQFLEILDTDLMSIYKNTYWGYKYNFFISAMQNCHPDYVHFLLNKKTLTVTSINEILLLLPKEKKLLYDENLIEKLYLDYQNKYTDDTNYIDNLKDYLNDKNILLIGLGNSILKEKNKIDNFINNTNSIIISVNFIPSEFKCDYVFISNSKRYNNLMNLLNINKHDVKMITTSNINTFNYKPDFVFNYETLLKSNNLNTDNALLLCLTLLERIKVKKVVLAGFDGFSKDSKDYYDISYSFSGNEEYRLENNKKISNDLKKISKNIEIEFLTDSIYQEGL